MYKLKYKHIKHFNSTNAEYIGAGTSYTETQV